MAGRVYALYDYDGTINNGNAKSSSNRFSDRHIQVTEGDELEIIEDDDEHIWKVTDTSFERIVANSNVDVGEKLTNERNRSHTSHLGRSDRR